MASCRECTRAALLRDLCVVHFSDPDVEPAWEDHMPVTPSTTDTAVHVAIARTGRRKIQDVELP